MAKAHGSWFMSRERTPNYQHMTLGCVAAEQSWRLGRGERTGECNYKYDAVLYLSSILFGCKCSRATLYKLPMLTTVLRAVLISEFQSSLFSYLLLPPPPALRYTQLQGLNLWGLSGDFHASGLTTSPESKFWEGFYFAMRQKYSFKKGLDISLSL